MRKLLSLAAVAALTLASAAPTQAGVSHHGVYHQDVGGHYRHSHRDWSGTGGRGHVHGPCWVHHHGQAVWICR